MSQIQQLMHAMYWSCADLLQLAAYVPNAPDLPPPRELRQRIAAMLDQMANRGIERGLTREDVEDARYALIAFLDEQIFQSAWSGKQDWLLEPLQLTYYNENTAGEGFFTRMASIENHPERLHVLQVYYLSLALGFQGMFAVKSPELRTGLIERLATKLSRNVSEVISPHGIPSDVGRKRTKRQLPVVASALGLLLLALVTVAGLKIAIDASASSAAKTIYDAVARTSTTSVGGESR